MQPSDLSTQFINMANQFDGINPVTFLMMTTAILLGILFVSFMTNRAQGSQIRAVIANSNLVLKNSEDRHNEDIKRFSSRLDDAEARANAAEDRASKAELRAEQKDIAARKAQDEKLKLIREYEKTIMDMRKEIDSTLRKISIQQDQFDRIINQKDMKIESLTSQNESLQGEVVEMGDENSELKDTIGRLLEENGNIKSELVLEKRKNEDLVKSIKMDDLAHSKELEELNTKIDELSNKVEELKSTKDKLEIKILDMEKKSDGN